MVTVADERSQVIGQLPEQVPDGLSVRKLLGTASLAGTTVLAGHAGLDRVVRGVNVMEVPDILAWVKPHELLLTTAFPLSRAPGYSDGSDCSAGDPAAALSQLVTALNDQQLAALAIKLGRYLDEVPEPVLALADRLGFPILRLPDQVAFDEILPDLYGQLLDQQSRVLAQADALHRAISAIVLGGGGLVEIATEVSRLLDCYVLITTPDGRVLAADGSDQHRAGIVAAGLHESSGRFLVERLPTGPYRLPTGGSTAMASIVAGGLDHGRIIAYRQFELPAGTVQAVERAAIVAALTITKDLAIAAVEGKFRGDYLRDVLTGLLPVDEQVIAHCRSLGWSIDRPQVVLVAELDPVEQPATGADAAIYRSQQERFGSAWQQVVRARDRTAPVVSFSQAVVALIPVPSAEADPVPLVAELVAAVSGDRGGGRRSFCAGASRVIGRPSELADGYAQARKAVSVGRRVHGHGSVSHFDSLGVHRLLSLVADPAELKSFAAEVLGELAGDSAEAADLRTTLQTLLDTNLNVAETARLLHFHYNTLRYRIGKLERILGPFSADPNLRLDVAVALQVIQMRGI